MTEKFFTSRNKLTLSKIIAAFFLIAFLLVAVTACAPPGAVEESPAVEPGEENDVQETALLRIAIPRDESSLNPYTYVSGYPGHNLLLMIYDTLFQLDAGNAPRAWLVESYEAEPGGLTWRFTLHDGITWHDGEPLTAADVKFSYEYYREYSHSRWTNAVSAMEEIAVENELTFTITLSDPVPAFLVNPLSDVPIIPAHIWQDIDDPDSFAGSTGSGPYRLVEHVPDQTYRLEANSDYFAGQPEVDEIGIVIIEDQTATFTALRVGEIDFAARGLLPELVDDFSDTGETDVVTGPGFVSSLLQINNEREPFNDPLVRRAIARAINVDDLVDTVMLGYATAGNPGYIHPELPFYRDGLEHIYDPEEARALLEEAGFYENYGNLEFELLTRSNDPLRVRTAEIIAGNLGDVGISVSVQALDSSTVDSLVWPEFDTAMGRDYDMAIWGWSAPVMIDPARLGSLYHSDLEGRGTLNIGAYASEEADALIAELAVTVDMQRQEEIHHALQEIVAETLPFVTLFYPDGIYAFRPGAYDGWVYQAGQGILNKLSFVNSR